MFLVSSHILFLSQNSGRGNRKIKSSRPSQLYLQMEASLYGAELEERLLNMREALNLTPSVISSSVVKCDYDFSI